MNLKSAYLPASIAIAVAVMVHSDQGRAQQAIDFSKPEVTVVNFGPETNGTTTVELTLPEFDFSKDPVNVTNFTSEPDRPRCLDSADLECSGNGEGNIGSGPGLGMGDNGGDTGGEGPE